MLSENRGLTGVFAKRTHAYMGANCTSIEQFMVVLDWLIRQRPDSAYSRFCLFRIAFDDPQTLGQTFGASDAMRRLNQFGTLLANTVRRTDLVARDLSVFWILTPECNSEIMGCRISEILIKVEEIGLDVVKCTVDAHVFPIENADVSSARVLLDSLASLPAVYKFEPA